MGGVMLRTGGEMEKEETRARTEWVGVDTEATIGNKCFESLREYAAGCMCFKMGEEN